jgi:acetyltransferase-like isoleucine patch superfamily enzyme
MGLGYYLLDEGSNNRLEIDSTVKFVNGANIIFRGNNNQLIIKKGCLLENIGIVFTGSNHTLIMEKQSELHGGNIFYENDDNFVHIGERTQIWAGFQIIAGEPNRQVIIGSDCLFSWSVRMRTTDGHSIWNMMDNERINRGKSIHIGNNVWFGESIQILKGTYIDNNTMVGTGSVLTGKKYPPNCVIAGNPAKVIKSNVYWKVLREDT